MSSVPLLPKVAITGLGLVSPFGAGQTSFFSALADGRSALALHPELSSTLPGDLARQPVWAGRVPDFGADKAVEAGKRRRMPRLSQMAIVAAREAMGLQPGAASQDAALYRRYRPDRLGVVLGTGLGCVEYTIDFVRSFLSGGLAAASPAVFPYTVMNASAGLVAIELALTGPNITVNHRELSLAESIATGAELLLTNRADAVLCGGCDELGPWLYHGLWRLGALAPFLNEGDGAPLHPYERSSGGIVPGEGAAIVLLERADAETSAPCLGYLSGWARAGDSRHRIGWPTVAASDGQDPSQAPRAHLFSGAAQSIVQSVQSAGLRPEDVSYVAGAGNGTACDAIETAALRAALGQVAERVPISSILGQCGESLMSTGLRFGAALSALRSATLPGTTHCRTPDKTRSLPGLVRFPTPSSVEHVLIPTIAQGGGNVSLVVSRA